MIQIATMFGIGYLPKAPGTWASLAAVLLAYLLLMLGREGVLIYLILLIALFFYGWHATAQLQAANNVEDPSWIVVDELVGQWIALLPAVWAVADKGLLLWPAFLTGFVFFRLFDITKPWIVGWADRRGDALGVMLDDVFAGVFAAVIVIILAGLYHGVMAR